MFLLYNYEAPDACEDAGEEATSDPYGAGDPETDEDANECFKERLEYAYATAVASDTAMAAVSQVYHLVSGQALTDKAWQKFHEQQDSKKGQRHALASIKAAISPLMLIIEGLHPVQMQNLDDIVGILRSEALAVFIYHQSTWQTVMLDLLNRVQLLDSECGTGGEGGRVVSNIFAIPTGDFCVIRKQTSPPEILDSSSDEESSSDEFADEGEGYVVPAPWAEVRSSLIQETKNNLIINTSLVESSSVQRIIRCVCVQHTIREGGILQTVRHHPTHLLPERRRFATRCREEV